MTANLSGNAQIFTPSIVPDEIFPLPVKGMAVPPGSPTHAPMALSPWYLDRFRGTCAYAPGDFNGDGNQDNLKVIGINYDQVGGIGGGIAYELTTIGSSTPYHSGFLSFPSPDRSQLQVAFTYAGGLNSGVWKDYYDVWAAFWSPNVGYYLERYQLDPNPTSSTAGLTLISTIRLSSNPTSSKISLSTNAYNRSAIIAWEEPGGIHLRAFSSDHGVSSTGIYPMGPDYVIPSSASCKFPDAAVESNLDGYVHVAFLNPLTNQIIKGKVGYNEVINAGGMIFGSAPFTQPWIVEDIENISIYNSALDGFQLQLVLRRYANTLSNIPWAYTYYNDDNNKINLRYQAYNKPSDPPTSPVTLVLNDGSLGNGDITSFGNAFPTITYVGDILPSHLAALAYNEILVGWYTTYDPSNPAAANPLYTYSLGGDSKKYVALKISEDPTLPSPLTTDYMEISNNYSNNNIGGGISVGYGSYWHGNPFICFSPQNDINPIGGVLCTFSGHGNANTYNIGGASVYGNSYSFPVKDGPLGTIIVKETNYIANKVITNMYLKSSFKTTNSGKLMEKAGYTSLDLYQNVFSEYNKFQLKETGDMLDYNTQLLSLQGQCIYSWKGSALEINHQINSSELGTLASGIYMLNTVNSNGEKQIFKLIKN